MLTRFGSVVMCFGLGGVMTKSKSDEAFHEWGEQAWEEGVLGDSVKEWQAAWNACAAAIVEAMKEGAEMAMLHTLDERGDVVGDGFLVVKLSDLETWVNGEKEVGSE